MHRYSPCYERVVNGTGKPIGGVDDAILRFLGFLWSVILGSYCKRNGKANFTEPIEYFVLLAEFMGHVNVSLGEYTYFDIFDQHYYFQEWAIRLWDWKYNDKRNWSRKHKICK
jgi:hypothetical protein